MTTRSPPVPGSPCANRSFIRVPRQRPTCCRRGRTAAHPARPSCNGERSRLPPRPARAALAEGHLRRPGGNCRLLRSASLPANGELPDDRSLFRRSEGEQVEQLGRVVLRHDHIRERREAISFGAYSSRPIGTTLLARVRTRRESARGRDCGRDSRATRGRDSRPDSRATRGRDLRPRALAPRGPRPAAAASRSARRTSRPRLAPARPARLAARPAWAHSVFADSLSVTTLPTYRFLYPKT